MLRCRERFKSRFVQVGTGLLLHIAQSFKPYQRFQDQTDSLSLSSNQSTSMLFRLWEEFIHLITSRYKLRSGSNDEKSRVNSDHSMLMIKRLRQKQNRSPRKCCKHCQTCWMLLVMGVTRNTKYGLTDSKKREDVFPDLAH
jgi:hypothetical protein